MTNNSIESLDQLFEQALAIAAGAEREAFVERVTRGNSERRERLLRLLRAAELAGDFLEQPAQPPQASFDSSAAGPPSGKDFHLHSIASTAEGHVAEQTIGPYRLLRKIGQGGMGVVYLAEQTAPVQRQVALKLIRPGFDTANIIARFELERKTLALMDHPNIAKVLDAGTTRLDEDESVREIPPDQTRLPAATQWTETGNRQGHRRPYFVMEYVNGAPITEYCNRQRLSLRQRLELFVPVCQAVQHAHQKGVIHRDLKPSNILVAEYEGTAVPKIIDFGVAKALDASIQGEALQTGVGAVIGTIEYMSPEQARLDSHDIDTRSDIYSLGAVLYELLTGVPPFNRAELNNAGLLEMLAVVRERDPQLPSKSLSNSGSLTQLAFDRGSEARRLPALVRGELDWLLLKSLEKDRNRRYQSASQFADDVRRFLKGQPITAAPPSIRYRCGKWIRKNWIAATMAATICLGLVLAFAGISWGYVRARAAEAKAIKLYREAEQARQEAAERAAGENLALLALQRESSQKDAALEAEAKQRKLAEAIREFVQLDVLALTTQEGQRRFGGEDLPRNATLRDLLMRSAQRLQQRQDLSSEVRAELCWTVGISLRAVGEFQAALPFLEQAVELYRELEGESSLLHWNAVNSLAVVLLRLGDYQEALDRQQRVVQAWSDLQGEDRIYLYRAQRAAAFSLMTLNRCDEADELLNAVAQGLQRLSHVDPVDWINVLLDQAKVQSLQGHYRQANAILKDLIVRFPLAEIADADIRETVMVDLANSYLDLGDLNSAEQLLAEVVPQMRSRLGDEHPSTLEARSLSASALGRRGQHDAAMTEYLAIAQSRLEILGAQHPDTVIAQNNLALGYQHQLQLDQAESLLQKAVRAAREQLGPMHPYTLQIEHNLGLLYQDLGQPQRAGQILKDVFGKCVDRYGSQHPKSLMSRNALAVNHRLLGDSQAAYDLLSQASPELLVALGSSHPDAVITQVNLAVFLKDLGRIPEATAILQQIAGLPFEQLAESSPLRWKATNNLAVICWRQKQLDRSIPLFQQVMEWHQRFPQQSNPRDLLMAQANLGINLRDAGLASEGVEFLWAAYDGGRQFAELAWVRAALLSASESSHREDLLWLIFWDDMAELTSQGFRGDPDIRWNEWRRMLARQGDIAALQLLLGDTQ